MADQLSTWKELAAQLRVDSIRCTTAAGSGHPTSGMSAADLMAVLLTKYLRYDWANPHAFLYLDIKGDKSQVKQWKIELGSPNALTRRGWTENSIRPGDEITVYGWRARNGSNLANANTVTLSGGRERRGLPPPEAPPLILRSYRGGAGAKTAGGRRNP